MILLTGAAGKTGRAVLKALAARGQKVRVFLRSEEQVRELERQGAEEAVIGDLTDPAGLRKAVQGVRAVYHICPNMHPEEIEIGRLAIDIAREYKLGHFVYHSVLHPQTEKMPHHWKKMRVEEMIFESGLNFTILQPAPYMQNILAAREAIVREGFYRVPYPPQTALSLVDLVDLGEAAAVVLTEAGHKNAVYEIVGIEAITQHETASIIGDVLGCKVKAEEINLDHWRSRSLKNGLQPYELDTLEKMFLYYSLYGLSGSPFVLGRLLGRSPGSLAQFAGREFVYNL